MSCNNMNSKEQWANMSVGLNNGDQRYYPSPHTYSAKYGRCIPNPMVVVLLGSFQMGLVLDMASIEQYCRFDYPPST